MARRLLYLETSRPKMLAHYAQRLPPVEINYTFRAMPKRETLEKWTVQRLFLPYWCFRDTRRPPPFRVLLEARLAAHQTAQRALRAFDPQKCNFCDLRF